MAKNSAKGTILGVNLTENGKKDCFQNREIFDCLYINHTGPEFLLRGEPLTH